MQVATDWLNSLNIKMPPFRDTFTPKKTPPRRCSSLSSLHTLNQLARDGELGMDFGAPVLNIAGQSWRFEDGEWLMESCGSMCNRDMQRMVNRNVQLEKENNLLKLKMEVLLDMLTEATVECHIIEKEMEEMKNLHNRKK